MLTAEGTSPATKLMAPTFAFNWYAAKGRLEMVKLVLATVDGVNVAEHDNTAFISACQKGNMAGLEGVDPAAQDNYALKRAAADGNLELVKFLVTLKGVDPGAEDDYAARWAAKKGHLDGVQFLATLPVAANDV